MKYTGENKLELFANNAQIIKKEFTWQNALTKRLAALLYAQEGKTIDCEAIRQCHALIKQSTGAFSTFRGNMALSLAAMLSLSANPQDVLRETMKVYDLLKGVKLRASDFLVIAAYLIATQSDASDYRNVVTRTRSFYDGMKAQHFFYTGQDDYIFAAMLGLTDLDPAAGTERIEQIHSLLKGEFGIKIAFRLWRKLWYLESRAIVLLIAFLFCGIHFERKKSSWIKPIPCRFWEY